MKKIQAEFTQESSELLGWETFLAGRWVAWALFLCCIALNVYVRLFPAYFPALKKQAVFNAIQAFSEKVQTESPGSQPEALPDILRRVKGAIQGDPQAFREKVADEYAKLKAPYQDGNGLTYLLDFDPYTWARWTRDIVEHGYPGNVRKNGKSFDTMLLAPLEVEVFHYKLLFYLTAFLYKGVHAILESVSFQSFIFFVPVFFAVCFFALLFLFACKEMNSWAAFWAVFSVGFVPMFLMRSSAGWYDFDVVSPFMALLVSWALIESLKADTRLGRCVSFAWLAAFLEGAYATVWMGWWFLLVVAAGYFLLVVGSVVVCRLGDVSKMRKEVASCLICAIIFFIGAPLTAYVLAGVNIFERFFFLKDFLHFGTLFSVDIWPNTVITVGEARPISLMALAQYFYSPLFFCAAVFFMLLAAFRELRTERRNAVLLMICWFLFMGVATLKANRFMAYLVIPWGLFFALGVGEYLPRLIQRKWNKVKKVAGLLAYGVLISCVFQTIFRSGTLFAEILRPAMTDPWRAALGYVDKNTPKDAIMNSEWGNACWFPYWGNRRVIVDGQFQYTPVNYWMARVFLEKDEEKAVRILRLINNSSFKTYEKIWSHIKESFLSEAILEKLLTLKEAEANKLLSEYGFTGDESVEVVRALYAEPSPAYLVVDGSLWGKIPSISIVGRWDFRKLYALRNRNQTQAQVLSELKRIYGVSVDEGGDIIRSVAGIREEKDAMKWISRQTPFYMDPATGLRKGEMVYFDFGLAFNLVTKEAVLHTPEGKGAAIFRNVVFFENGQRYVIENKNGNDDRAVLLAQQGDAYKALITDLDLAESVLAGLLLARGSGLRHFEPFYADAKNSIYIYKIHWSAEQP